ncbi:MAG TPA: hypothetical protein VGP24_16015 [Glaciihabitans sp.]|jgi:hypothetical protein|nr:hypothetical protein [Glaciihabitans sp.]
MRINQEAVTPELPAILGAGALALGALALSFLAASMAGNHRAPAPAPRSVQTLPAVHAFPPVVGEVTSTGLRLGGL